MAEPGSSAPGTQGDCALEVFGETVIIRRDPGGALDVAVIEEIVPPGVAAPLHRHGREDEISYVIAGAFRIWRGNECSTSALAVSHCYPAIRSTPSRTLVRSPAAS